VLAGREPNRRRDPATRERVRQEEGRRQARDALTEQAIRPTAASSGPDGRPAQGRPRAVKEDRTLATATATQLRPLGDRVVIQPIEREEMTKSGIVLPDTAKEKPQEGKVLAVGPGRILDDGKREQIDVKKGDKVLYAKYAGTEFKVDGEELLIVSQKDILAVVEG
jgi:chaperonin GroES